MGKYSHIASTLTRKPEASDFQTKVDEHKRSVTETTPATLAHALIKIRAEKETIKKALGRINVRLVAYEQLLSEAFEDAGVATIKLDTGASVSTQIKPYARVHDRAAFRQWCIDHGLEAALVLPWQSTNALVSERLMDGLPEPDGIDTYKQTTIIVRKGRS